MSNRKHSGGFTLTELMVVTVIMAIVITGALTVFTTQHRTYVKQERIVEVQEDVRLVTELMRADMRMGGFLVSPIVGVSSRDGGTNGSDAICASDPGVLDDAAIAATLDRFEGSTLFSALGANADSVQLVPSSMDIDSDGDDDYAVDAGIILSDGTLTHCARIVDVSGNVVTFTPATPSGFSIAPPTARAAPALIYEVTASGLMRNGVLFSTQVENVQAEFAVDADGDGTIAANEFPIHDLNTSVPSQVRRMRISVITRTSSEDPSFGGSGMPAAGNRVAGSPDGFVRRRITMSVVPRNLM